jgi:HEAT repeat protein
MVKQFALYPFFIVLGIVAVFTLFSLLLRQQKNEGDYLRELRTARGSERWYAAFQLSNLIARRGDELRHDPQFLEQVVGAYKSSADADPRVQRYLAIVLGRVGDASVEPLLVEGLDDSDVETRMWCAWALGKIAAPDAVPPLVKSLGDTDPAVRKMSAYALGSLHDASAIEPLTHLLEDAVEDVRWNAAIALAEHGDGAGYGILQQMVNSVYLSRVPGMTDERVKDVMLNAVKALGVLQATSPSARDLLEETSRSAPFPLVQREAREQLARPAAPAGG